MHYHNVSQRAPTPLPRAYSVVPKEDNPTQADYSYLVTDYIEGGMRAFTIWNGIGVIGQMPVGPCKNERARLQYFDDWRISSQFLRYGPQSQVAQIRGKMQRDNESHSPLTEIFLKRT